MAEGSGDQNSTENAAPAQNHSTQNGTSDGDYLNTTWGLPANEVYRLALTFFKEKEGKAMHLTYKDKLKLVAFTKQVAHGKYRPDGYPEVGFLDVVGNDRKLAWQSLGDMSKESAMTEFVRRLDELCPLFKPHVQAHKTELEEQERKKREEEEKARQELEEKERQKAEEEARQQQELEQQRQYEQEMQMRAALNQQTAAQFKQYAEHQYPDNKEMQEVLVRQLQEQHFQQYMQQVYQQQLIHQQQQYQQLQAMQKTDEPDSQIPNNIPATNTVMPSLVTNGLPTNVPESNPGTEDTGMHDKIQSTENDEEYDGDDEHNEMPPISAASMWTRKDLKDFKDSIRKDPDSVIKVGSGETVTVRVPTHEDGTCLFWEFATDHYDIGFGVYFEWTIAPSSAVSVHVSESSDDEDIEEEEVSSGEGKGDVEQGANRKEANHPPTDEIIPVYRRDCHEEVYCGSHMYPGRGVYLLKFDNSYSLWRSKTLYYRVYYTR